jgi:selenocysteine-specific elongation factor
MSGSTVNINVGVVGHVDSGKTSLVRALSTHISTAALDKNPQSQARGITLDLGFSSFTLDVPERLASSGVSRLQFTLVDCPGHASLIRTIIGGAHIIDMMLLVVDAVKGVQTQTAECLVVGEITTDKLVVVLNKTDLLPEATREAAIEKAAARIRKVLATTKFADAPIIPVAAAPGGKPGEAPAQSATASAATAQGEGAGEVGVPSSTPPSSVAPLVSHLLNTVTLPVRDDKGPFLFAVDHCECASARVCIH